MGNAMGSRDPGSRYRDPRDTRVSIVNLEICEYGQEKAAALDVRSVLDTSNTWTTPSSPHSTSPILVLPRKDAGVESVHEDALCVEAVLGAALCLAGHEKPFGTKQQNTLRNVPPCLHDLHIHTYSIRALCIYLLNNASIHMRYCSA